MMSEGNITPPVSGPAAIPPSKKTVLFDDEIRFEDVNKAVVICRQIAQGGFSNVFLARDARTMSKTRELYALKRIKCLENDRETLDTCREEARIHNMFIHKSLMPLLGFQFQSPFCYMLFPYIPLSLRADITARKLLADVLESKRRPYSEREALTIFAGIVSGVRTMHEAGLSHRDITVENVLLQENVASGKHTRRGRKRGNNNRTPVLLDFGSAGPLTVPLQTRRHVDSVVKKAVNYSTLPYRAPELLDGGGLLQHYGLSKTFNYGPADVWSMGCLFFAVLFGTSPFETKWTVSLVEGHAADATVQIVDVSQLNVLDPIPFPPDGSAADRRYGASKDLVRWMLNRDWKTRPSCVEVAERVEKLLLQESGASTRQMKPRIKQSTATSA